MASVGNEVRRQIDVGLLFGELVYPDFRRTYGAGSRTREPENRRRARDKTLNDLDAIASVCFERV
jgi:hypothetical protein